MEKRKKSNGMESMSETMQMNSLGIQPLCPYCLKKMRIIVHNPSRKVLIYCPHCNTKETKNYKQFLKEQHKEEFKKRYALAKKQYKQEWSE